MSFPRPALPIPCWVMRELPLSAACSMKYSRKSARPAPDTRRLDSRPLDEQFSPIDADGVLEDQHVGDADIEGKLKKLIARAVESSSRKPSSAVPAKSSAEAN